MKSGDMFLDDLKASAFKKNKYILVGETFYLQLFINFNLLNLNKIYVLDIGLDLSSLWSESICIETVKEIIDEPDLCIIFCGISNDLKQKHVNKCEYDFFDIDSIKENGIFVFNGQRYIVDDVKYVASAPDYMKRAYKSIQNEFLFDYLQELSKEPASRCFNKKICLYDYNGKYIHHVNGFRKNIFLSETYEKTIHVFGDSRVSGYMLEDKDLFTNMLQYKLNSTEKKYRVLNYGIPGREIDRIEYQIKESSIKKNDIVFILTGCYEYRNDAHEKQMEFAFHLKRIKKYLDRKSVVLYYINLPTSVEIINPSSDEVIINKLYRNYKFCEYTFNTVSYYKTYLFSLLSNFEIRYYDAALDFNKPHENLLFINMHHYSPYGNEILKDIMFNLILELSADRKKAELFYKKSIKSIKQYVKNEKRMHSAFIRTYVSFHDREHFFFFIKLWIVSFFKEIFLLRKNSFNGAIVMNANPFTLGHRYLVEYASKKCDHLYVFVLQEDKSEFNYYDRINMVYQGVKDLKNVTVRPSGTNIISEETFPEYFMKKELQDAKINAYKDIESFALSVAPVWGITERFFGEEPFDNVTRQYNEQMKKYLPIFSINVVEIPRKIFENEVISASRVRKLIKDQNWEEIEKIVPKTTFNYCRKLFPKI